MRCAVARVVACLAVFATLLATGQQETGTGAYELGEVVVTGERPGAGNTTSVSVIDEADIRVLKPQSLADILAIAPGMHVRRGARQEAYLRLRGFRQREVLVLLNGIPIESANTGQVNLESVPVEMIQRVEVIRGAGSSLYGPTSLGGVVNIVTKKGKGRPSAFLESRLLEEGASYGEAGVSGSAGPVNFVLSGSYLGSDGFPLSHDFSEAEFQDDGRRLNSDVLRRGLFLNLGIDPDERTSIGVTFLRREGEYGIPPLVEDGSALKLSKPKFERMDGTSAQELQLAARRELLDWLTLRGSVFHTAIHAERTTYDDKTYSSVTAKDTGVETQDDASMGLNVYADVQLDRFGLLSLGWSSRRNTFATEGYLRNSATKVTSFDVDVQADTHTWALEHRFSPTEPVEVALGLSYSLFDKEGGEDNIAGTRIAAGDDNTEWCPQAGVAYHVTPSDKLYGNVAKKARFPTLRELYETKVKSGKSVGNADLRPQESVNYELGYEKEFSDKLTTRVAGFYHDIDNFIEKVEFGGDEAYRNIRAVSAHGVETEVRFTPNRFVSLGANYTWLAMEDQTTSRNEIQYRPKHRIGWLGQLRLPLRFRLQVDGSYAGEQFFYDSDGLVKYRLDDVTIVNMRLTHELRERCEMYVGVSNLFDEDYEESYALPRPGRIFYAGARLVF